MNKHVLVIADIEDDDFLSLEKARDIAHDISASLEIVKFIQYDSNADGPLDYFIASAEQKFADTIAQVFDSSIKQVSKVVIREQIDEWIVERCNDASAQIDLVIKGGHRTETLFHTPTDWKLIRHLPCPILIASHTKWNSKSNILMTLDLYHEDQHHGELNALTLGWGEIWASATHTRLHAMYSIPIARPLLELDIVDKHKIETEKAPAAEQKLQTLLEEYELSSAIPHISVGPPEKAIPHLANELNSDLVIMGCLGREGLSGFLLGNTAEKVLHHIRTDCLIIKLPEM